MKIKGISAVVIVMAIFYAAMPAGTLAVAQTKSKRASTEQTQPVAAGAEQPGQKLAKAVEEYKAALNNLASLYDVEVKKTTNRNTQLKELFEKGIVSRVELEKSQSAVTEAQAKVDAVHKQISSAEAIRGTDNESPGSAGLAVQWSTGSARVDGLIRHYGGMYGVDPFLVYCVAHQESGFSPSAVSPKGAQGLMQLMPDTAARYGVSNPYDPEQNIRAGVHYLKDLLLRFNGNIELALAGYNAGEGAVMRNGNTVPRIPETQFYVRSIGKRYSSGASASKASSSKGNANKNKSAKPAPTDTGKTGTDKNKAMAAPVPADPGKPDAAKNKSTAAPVLADPGKPDTDTNKPASPPPSDNGLK
jgi:soluble lytic murein transglycosylase-like protein